MGFRLKAGAVIWIVVGFVILIAGAACVCAAQESPPDAAPAAPPAANPGPVRVSSGVSQGYAISQPAPSYPKDAKAQHVQGVVVMHAIISKTGTIENLQVISGPDLLRKSAMDAVSRWKYKPFMLKGEPTEVETTINVNFTFSSQPAASLEGFTGSSVAPPPQDARVKVPASTMASLLISKVDPVIPPDVHTAGTVILHVIISKLGSVENVEVVNGDPVPAKAVSDAVKHWKYRPFELNGAPVEVLTTISVPFDTSGSPPPQQQSAFVPDPDHPLRKIGGGVTPPVLTHHANPVLTGKDRGELHGVVLVNLIVDEHGWPQNVHVVRGVGTILDMSAVISVKQYRFRPAMEGDKPVPVELNIEINF